MSNTCSTGKTRYTDCGVAREALRGIKARKDLRQGDELEPYWCTGCGGVHLGNRRPSDRRRQRVGGRRADDRRKK
jgi:hypothetical protein